MEISIEDYDDKERSCTRKVRYPRVEIANAAVRSMTAKGRNRLESYSCDYCQGWHVGHAMTFGRLFKFIFGIGK